MAITKGMRGRPRRLGVIGSAGVTALAALAVMAVPASASDVERRGHGECTRSSDWELELEKEDGAIKVKVDLDTPTAGRAWRVRIWHDGFRDGAAVRRTHEDGDLRFVRRRADLRGADSFHFRAVDLVNGEVCRGTLSI